jgi:hypothetical protein
VRRIVVALGGLLLLAGCATVPSESAPVVIGTAAPDAPGMVVKAPLSGREPDLLVCDFISAGASPTDRHAAARQYLTKAASAGWEDATSTTILDNVACLPDDGAGSAPDRSRILLRGDAVGTLSATGQYTVDPTSTPYAVVVDLEQVGGQWRIATPPTGVVLRTSEFKAAYRRLPVYFLDPGLDTVVPDPRWVVDDPDSLAARLVDLLVAGPSSDLAPAVVSELPPQVSLRSNVSGMDAGGGPSTVRGNGVRIDFSGLGALDSSQRRLLAAQVVWTLDAASVGGPYVLLSDGAPLDEAHPSGWTTSDVVSTDPAASPGASVALHAVVGGALVEVGENAVTPVPGALGGYSSLQAAALSRDGTRVAAVAARAGGGSQLLVGPSGGGVVSAAAGDSMTRPTWSADGSAVWVVQDGATVLRVSQDVTTQAVSTQQVDSSTLATTPGSISALRLSRDGVRAALVVGGQVVVAEVTRTDLGTVALSTPRVVAPSLGATATTLDWTTADTLLVVSTDPDRPVVSVTVDGSGLTPLPTGNLSVPVRAVASSPTRQLVADIRGVLELTSGETTGVRVWRPVAGLGGEAGPRTLPVLPG